MQEKHRFHMLDVYRGVAALLVVLYHITGEMLAKFHYVFLGGFFNFGNIGVDFFFVLSGFIIFYIHHKDGSNWPSIARFFKKRAIRIYPSYIAIAAIVVGSFVLFGRFIENKPQLSVPYLLATFTLFPHGFRIIPPSWTLTQELYFYMLFGLLLFIPNVKIRLGVFFAVAIVFFLGSFLFANLSQEKESTYIIQTAITPFLLEFVGGCIAGYVFSHIKKTMRWRQFWILGLISLIGFLVAMNIRSSVIFIPLITLVFSIFIWATGALEATYKIKVNKLLFLIGGASYVIYLMHTFIVMVILKLVYTLWRVPHNPIFLFSIGLTAFVTSVAVSVWFYLWYEKPVLRFLRKKLV